MQENLQGEWSPDTLACAVNLSSSRFQHLFKDEVGMAPAHYLRALRMEQARKLLQTSRLTVKQIMNGVGVEDKSYFAREFKKVTDLHLPLTAPLIYPLRKVKRLAHAR
jgi:AraC-like DNA-binding protein